MKLGAFSVSFRFHYLDQDCNRS